MPEPAAGVCALVLAAGQGQRFRAARDEDKLLAGLELDGTTRPVLEHVLHAAVGAAERTRVLVRQCNRPLRTRLAETAWPDECVIQPVLPGGVGDSLALGAAGQDPALGFLIVLGDMPWVRRATFAALAAAIRPNRLVVPVYRGCPGHPRGVGRNFRSQLLECRGDRGLASLFASERVTQVAVDDPGVLRDVDHPEDLFAASGMERGKHPGSRTHNARDGSP